MKLNEVDHPLLSPQVIKELQTFNVVTVSAFLAHNIGHLSTKCSLSLEEIIVLRKFLIHRFGPKKVHFDEYQTLPNPLFESFMADHIYEIFGAPGTGKSQLAMYLSAQFAQQGKNVFYIDTKNDFSLHRLKNFLRAEDHMKNIKLGKAFDMHEAIRLTQELLKIQRSICDFLVLDNIATLVWPLLEDDVIGEAMDEVSCLVKTLRQIAYHQKCAVLIVNGAAGNGTKPALGKIFAPAAKTKFSASKSSPSLCQIRFNDQIINVEINSFEICKLDNKMK